MRCLSGTSWGSSKKVLLTLYKSLILSKLDYCSFLYMNAADTTLQKIDTIQYKSLLLAVGGMRGTALNALLGDCGELPMKYRKKIILKYLLKIHDNTRNSASAVLLDKKFFSLELNCKSQYKVFLNSFLLENNIVLTKDTDQFNVYSLFSCEKYIDLTMLAQLEDFRIKSDANQRISLINSVLADLKSSYRYVFFVDGSSSRSCLFTIICWATMTKRAAMRH